ncbi:hypothetical protein ACT5M9_08350 [Aeromonas sp. AE23HZ002T15]
MELAFADLIVIENYYLKSLSVVAMCSIWLFCGDLLLLLVIFEVVFAGRWVRVRFVIVL